MVGRKPEVVYQILQYIRQRPFYFYDIVRHFEKEEYKDLLVAWTTIRSKEKFDRDEDGRYILK
jgi:hypothetical protein